MEAFEIITSSITFTTSGNTDIIDITPQISNMVAKSGIKEGNTIIFVSGSTAAVTTIEFERGAVMDLKEAIDKLAPQNKHYRHNERWGDGNGHAHVRAALLGPSLSVPIFENKLLLGTWQQIVLIDFDNHPRQRVIAVQISGKKPIK